MTILLTGSGNGYLQFIAVLFIFVGVLAVTAITTKWVANYQKGMNVNSNIEIIETARLTNNKYIQIIRLGEEYIAVAVCKDTVTVLDKIPGDKLRVHPTATHESPDFKALLNKFMKKDGE